MVKSKTTQIQKLPVFATLFEALQSYKANFLLLSKVTLVVALPVGLLQLAQIDIGDSSILASVAWGYTILAVLYVLLTTKLPSRKLSRIYTEVSGHFLQYVVVTAVLILCSLPLLMALVMIILLMPVYSWSPLLAIPFGLVLVAASLYLFSKWLMALAIVASQSCSSWAAMGLSGRLSRQNHVRISAVLVIITIVIVGIMTGIATLASLAPALNENQVFNSLLYVVESTIFVPIFLAVLAKMYQKLS